MDGRFDAAARAVVDGDIRALEDELRAAPELVHARSDDEFRATLLHHVAANGIPDELQRSPGNAGRIAARLLEAGAEPDAQSGSYGGGARQTTLCLLVSSWHPFAAGVQSDLVRVLVDGGAQLEGTEADGAPVSTALVFGYTEAAETLHRLGAGAGDLVRAAGLGLLAEVEGFLVAPGRLAPGAWPSAAPIVPREAHATDASVIQEAFHMAITHGRLGVAELLLGHGATVGGVTHGHHCQLPLVQALFVRRSAAARWLLERGADADAVDGKRGVSARGAAEAAGLGSVLGG